MNAEEQVADVEQPEASTPKETPKKKKNKSRKKRKKGLLQRKKMLQAPQESVENIEDSETKQLAELTQMVQNMQVPDFEKAIEAVLFAAGRPVTYEHLAKMFQLKTKSVRDIVMQYAEQYNQANFSRGITLLTLDSCCQLCTNPEYLPFIRMELGIKKSGGSLSPSMLEVLAIIAYRQPVTRLYIDQIRNANSDYAMRSLLDRELIEVVGRQDAPGRPLLYGTTITFLRCFGISTLDDLPGKNGESENLFQIMENKMKISEDPQQMSITDLLDPDGEYGTELSEDETIADYDALQQDSVFEEPDDADSGEIDDADEDDESDEVEQDGDADLESDEIDEAEQDDDADLESDEIDEADDEDESDQDDEDDDEDL